MTPLDRFELALREHGCKGRRPSWTCPAHEDRSPSLSVKAAADGRVLVHCFAGCETDRVVEALDLQLADLFDRDDPRSRPPFRRRPIAPPPLPAIRGRMGLPTDDDLFWAQSDEVIDAHFAAVLARNPEPPRKDALVVHARRLRGGSRRRRG